MRRALLGLLALALVPPVLAGPPARAASSYGSVTGIDGVLYDDCLPHPYSYDVSVPGGSGYWDLTTELVGPDGHVTAGDYVAKPGQGASSFGLLCPPADRFGTYTIRASVRWGADESSLGLPAALPDAHFTLRKPHSRTRLAVSTTRPAHRQVLRFRVTAYDERPAGFVRRAFAWVHLERKRAGRWVRITGGRAVTHDTGRVTIRWRYPFHHRRIRVRAVTEPTPTYARSTSPVRRLW